MTILMLTSQMGGLENAQAENSSLHFQRPRSANARSRQAKMFRRPGIEYATDEPSTESRTVVPPVVRKEKPPAEHKPIGTPQPSQQVRQPLQAVKHQPRQAIKRQPRQQPKRQGGEPVTAQSVALLSLDEARPSAGSYQEQVGGRDRRNSDAKHQRVQYETDFDPGLSLTSHGCALCEGPCNCDSNYGNCGLYEAGCGIAEPSCGCGEPSCGICEPTCGCGDIGCGSCVGRPGPDYWCFPICLPRCKDLSVFGGVQGFRGPRDFDNNRSDSNFGFNGGLNLSGSAPLIGLLFPQLSYQLGYRAVQSRLHGTATSTDDRGQQFVTAGLFRRVNTGIQFGLVWDLMEDDLDSDVNLQQLRYEISLKSPQGREIGFFGTNNTNDELSMATLYKTVDQYALFVRWAFGNGYESRLWGGGTGDGEGLFGGEFYAPLSSRWAVQSGFNYLITDEADGLAGVSEESWNIGINLVWHLGKTAKRGCRSPYRPLFSVADNGWMFVD